jgi:hypothetical protein
MPPGDVCCQTQAYSSTKVLIESQARDVSSKGRPSFIYLTCIPFRKKVKTLEEINTLKETGEDFFPLRERDFTLI